MQDMSAKQQDTPASSAMLVRQFMDEVWNAASPDAVPKFLDAGYVDHAYRPPNAKGLVAMLRLFNNAFADARHHIEEITAEAGQVTIRTLVEARHVGSFRGIAATGNVIRVRQYRSFGVRNGRIVAHDALFDTAALLTQIGGSLDATLACNRP